MREKKTGSLDSFWIVVRTGASLSILFLIAYGAGVTQMIPPFAATCALLAILPNAPFSKPRTIIVSHLLCIGIGAALMLLPVAPLFAAFLGGWFAIMSMAILRAVHAPAVAHTIILIVAKPQAATFVVAVLGTALIFAAFSYISGRIVSVVPSATVPEKA